MLGPKSDPEPAPDASPRPLDDGALVDLVLDGDLDAFEQLMRCYNQRLFRAARAILTDGDEAQDAVQQAWIASYRHLASWERRGALSTWLLRIVVREAGRRRRAPERAHLELVDTLAEEEAPSPEVEAARAHLRVILETAIDWLPDTMRAVLVLRDVEELSGRETAECLGLSDENVRVRLHRARRLLRDHLEDVLVERVGEAFPFLGARCDEIVAAVFLELQEEPDR